MPSQSKLIREYYTSVTATNRVLNERGLVGYAYSGSREASCQSASQHKPLCLVVPYLAYLPAANFGFPADLPAGWLIDPRSRETMELIYSNNSIPSIPAVGPHTSQ